MAISIPNVKFELSQVYKTYVDQLLLAYNISDFLIDSSNLNSAGNQVEQSLRILLKNLLPERVTVTHGHIVDKNAKVSNQQDVLLADSFFTKSLIKSIDGTEFYPYEAIFSCGEVKKTWSQSKLLSAVKSIERNKTELYRYKIDSDMIESGSNFIKISDSVTSNEFRNPLFSFVFSIDFDKTYSEKKISEIYNDPNNQKKLPNISVILNHGIIVCIDKNKIDKGELSIILYPEFISNKNDFKWVLLTLKPEENLAYLIFMLTQHINDTVLEKISSMKYGETMIEINKSNISPL